MTTRRTTVPLPPHDHAALAELYLVYRIPIDQYEHRPLDLRDFIRDWNNKTGRNDSAGDIVHYMKTKRKGRKWVTFDGKHKIAPPPSISLTVEQSETLVEIYEEHVLPLGHCSDILSVDEELADLVSKEFSHRTRRRVPADVLVARLTSLRKRGLLPGVRDTEQAEFDEDIGFRDIDDVGDIAG